MAHRNSSSVKSYGKDYLHEAPKTKGYMGSPTCDTFYPELKGWMPPIKVMQSIGLSDKEIYWRYAICRMAQKAVFEGCPMFAGKDSQQEFFQVIAQACAGLQRLPAKAHCVDDIGEPVFTDDEYSKLKGVCSRNCYARYKKMRAAVKAMEGKA